MVAHTIDRVLNVFCVMSWFIELGEKVRPIADAIGLMLVPFVLIACVAVIIWKARR